MHTKISALNIKVVKYVNKIDEIIRHQKKSLLVCQLGWFANIMLSLLSRKYCNVNYCLIYQEKGKVSFYSSSSIGPYEDSIAVLLKIDLLFECYSVETVDTISKHRLLCRDSALILNTCLSSGASKTTLYVTF